MAIRTARKGRGAATNEVGRFERFERHAIDDGWGSIDEELPRLVTEVLPDKSRTAITYNNSPDIPFDRSINAFRGCEHGCVYCYARPTHAYLGLSPGQDFESKLFAKFDAARLLKKELGKKSYECRAIAFGTNTDPYQPIEQKLEITRQILEVLDAHNHPVTIVTKSSRITRDLDILSRMAERNLVFAALSVTTLDRDLARTMEPRAATPGRRLEALAELAAAGIPTGVMVAPMIPALNDSELEAILAKAAEAGAKSAGYVFLRLPMEIKELFEEWLDTHVPDRKNHVLALLRQARGGDLYRSGFGERMRGTGPFADLLERRFQLACRRLGLSNARISLDTSSFVPPAKDERQLSLL